MAKRKGWLESFLEPDVERAERRTVDQFAAHRWNGTNLVQEAVRDISPTGVYILTEERWRPGTLVSLTLQREGPLEMSSERRIVVQAKVARCGKDGVGLAFVFASDDQKSRQWENVKESLIEETKPENMLKLVRMAEAVSFLSQICPEGAEEIGQLLKGRLSSHKVANAVEITLKAQNLLSVELAAERLRAEPRLVERILENGSCTDEGWLMHFWGGLLATSCAADGIGELSSVLVELFSQLTTYPVRILVVVCTRATKFLAESGLIFAKPLACRIEELSLTTGSRGLQIERDLRLLSDLGLIEKKGSNSPTLLPSDEILLTPTCLGLQLFAHCNGQRGSLRKFYDLNSAKGAILRS
ncbi:MAG: PilZ domain-containing protein [Terracidiphilus sp.]